MDTHTHTQRELLTDSILSIGSNQDPWSSNVTFLLIVHVLSYYNFNIQVNSFASCIQRTSCVPALGVTDRMSTLDVFCAGYTRAIL